MEACVGVAALFAAWFILVLLTPDDLVTKRRKEAEDEAMKKHGPLS